MASYNNLYPYLFIFIGIWPFFMEAQSEKKEKIVIIPNESSPLLVSPKTNMLLNFKFNDLTPNKDDTPSLKMMGEEKFLNPSDYYTDRMNKKQGEKNKNSNLYWLKVPKDKKQRETLKLILWTRIIILLSFLT